MAALLQFHWVFSLCLPVFFFKSFPSCQLWHRWHHQCDGWPGEEAGHPVQRSGHQHDQVVFYLLCAGVWRERKSHHHRARYEGTWGLCERWRKNRLDVNWSCVSEVNVPLDPLGLFVWDLIFRNGIIQFGQSELVYFRSSWDLISWLSKKKKRLGFQLLSK